MNDIPSDLIDLLEAAKLSGLSREGIYYHAKKGNLKIYRRVGQKKSFVSKAELENLISFKEVKLEPIDPKKVSEQSSAVDSLEVENRDVSVLPTQEEKETSEPEKLPIAA
jgi:predicted DNA-binding transcriptional regulator AlpA